MIQRGTTPTLTFEFPFSLNEVKRLELTFVQGDEIVLQKRLEDFLVSDMMATLRLTEQETLSLNSRKIYVQMQFKVDINGDILASNIMSVDVGKILSGEVLYAD